MFLLSGFLCHEAKLHFNLVLFNYALLCVPLELGRGEVGDRAHGSQLAMSAEAACDVVALELTLRAPRAFQLAKLRGWTPSVALLASGAHPGDRGTLENARANMA